METVLINKDKIKIMLNRHDMQKYHISSELTGSSNETELKIWNILDDISSLTSFDTHKGSFYVQMFPSKTGGCELFISRIDISSKLSENESCKKSKTKLYIYKFHELSQLLSVCKAMAYTELKIEASAFYDEGCGTYYLTSASEIFCPAEFFGEKCKSAIKGYLKEHCRLISDDAANVLSKLAL